MASGNTLLTFDPRSASFPAANYATHDERNSHPVLDFDPTTQETAFFEGILPRHYAGGGITVYVHWAASTDITGTVGWDVAIERIGSVQDLDVDSFATAQVVTAATVSGTAGIVTSTNVAITNGANMDSLAVGEKFRLQLRRDVATDTAAGDAELIGIEIKET